MDTTHLKVWLPFDESATLDRCGNSWTAYGTTSIDGQALQLNKGYLRSDAAIEFGGADFTVDFYAYMNSSSEQWAGLFVAQSTTNTFGNSRRGQIAFHRNNTANTLVCDCYDANGSKLCDVTLSNTSWLNGRHHFELDYSHATSTLKIFIGGRLSLTQTITLERLSRYIFLGVNSYDPPVQRMVGTIDEFRLFDGVALHTTDFTPPIAADYDAITSWAVTVNADVEVLIANRAPSSGYWRYENPGSGDYMDSQLGVVTETVDYKQSVTGVAFHNGNQSDMCNTPAGVREIWMRFDLYWESRSSSTYVICYVGNQATAGFYGVRFGGSAMDNSGNRCFFTNSDTEAYLASPSRNRCLLHMISGITDGFMEFTLNGAPYVCVRAGNVNNGEDFRNPFFYNFVRIWNPDWNGLFSNIVVSNAPLSLDDGWHRNQLPVEHNIKAVDLCVRKNGRTYEIPFSTTNSAPANSVVARVGHKTVYNPLVATTDENASVLKVRCNGEDRALSASFN